MMKQENKIHLLKFHGKTCFPACFLFGNYFVIFCVCSKVSVKSWYCRKPRLSYWIVKANQNKINLNFLVELPSLYIMSESDPGNFADSFWSSFSLQEICLLPSRKLENYLEGSILKPDLDWLKLTVALFIPQGVPIPDWRIQPGNIVKKREVRIAYAPNLPRRVLKMSNSYQAKRPLVHVRSHWAVTK